MAETIMGKSEGKLSNMFEGERATVSKEGEFVFDENMSSAELKRFINEQDSLPDSVKLFLNSMAQSLPEFSNRIEGMMRNQKAAEILWNRFGKPLFSLAIPVFNLLTHEVVEATNVLYQEIDNMENHMQKTLDAIKFYVQMFYEAEIIKAEEELEKNQVAVINLGDVVGQDDKNIKTRTVESTSDFKNRTNESEKKVLNLNISMENWQDFVERIKANSRAMGLFIEKGMDLALDPAQAL